jgi:ribosomal protein S18 acetylase RimI-like enzyme
MTTIIRAKKEDYKLLTEIGVPSFLTAHGHSATKDVVDAFMKKNYSEEAFKKELEDNLNIYHIIYHDGNPAGYAKIRIDANHVDISKPNVTKLERMYLLKEYFGMQLAQELVRHNIDFAKKLGQEGMWLHVWIENPRAVAFYKKVGFKVIGAYNFKLSEEHYNPNHHMYLEF